MKDFIVKDNSNYKYFSMIPHIITEIGLRGNEIAVYVAIKRAAGENGICVKSKAKLAKNAGVCPKTIFSIIQKLCEVNKILNKPLITCTSRLTECGDKDTNLIEIIDIWPEATNLFSKIISGEVMVTPPQVTVTGGVGYPLPEGQVTITHKEESIKNNLSKEDHHQSSSSESMIDDDLLHKNKKVSAKLNSKEENKILICRDVHLTVKELESCIKAKGSRALVEETICAILDWEGRDNEIKNWEKTIKDWKLKKTKLHHREQNEEFGQQILDKINSKYWSCRFFHDKKKDDKGLLFESQGVDSNPTFFSFFKKTFKTDVTNFINQKKIPTR